MHCVAHFALGPRKFVVSTHTGARCYLTWLQIETSSQPHFKVTSIHFLYSKATWSILYWHRGSTNEKRGSVPTHFGGLSNVCQMNRDEEKECRYLYCSSKLCTPRTKSHPVFYWRGSFPKHPYVHLSPSGVCFCCLLLWSLNESWRRRWLWKWGCGCVFVVQRTRLQVFFVQRSL